MKTNSPKWILLNWHFIMNQIFLSSSKRNMNTIHTHRECLSRMSLILYSVIVLQFDDESSYSSLMQELRQNSSVILDVDNAECDVNSTDNNLVSCPFCIVLFKQISLVK